MDAAGGPATKLCGSAPILDENPLADVIGPSEGLYLNRGLPHCRSSGRSLFQVKALTALCKAEARMAIIGPRNRHNPTTRLNDLIVVIDLDR
jgi:hypothetical protein